MRRLPMLKWVFWSLLLLAVLTLASSGALAHAVVGRALLSTSESASGANAELATTGCGKPVPIPPGSSADVMLRSGGLARFYRLHVPISYHPTRYTPLVLSFHGHGSDMLAQERLTGFSALADRQGFLVVYPQGTVGPDGQTGWATGPRKDPTVNDVRFVNDLLTLLQMKLCIDPQRIYASGFSNGGGMTALLACTMAGRIAGFASVSGSYYPLANGCHPARPAPILEIHGTADTVVPYLGSLSLNLPSVSEWLDGWVQHDGCIGQPVIFFRKENMTGERWFACKGGAVIIHYRINGGKHVWPPFVGAPGEAIAQHTAALIWAFFHVHILLYLG